MKKFSSFLSVCVVLSVVLGNFSLPVLAYEKNGVNFEQIKTGTISNNNGATFNKINSSSKEIKSFSSGSLITKKENLSEPKKKLGTDLLKLIDSNFLLPTQNRAQLVFEMKGLKQFVASGDSVATIDKRVANKAHNDLVYVYVGLNPTAQTSAIDSLVWKVTDRDEKNHLAVAFVEVNKLEVLVSLSEVRSVSSVMPPVVRSGSVITEGDIIHQTATVRSAYSQGGAGIKIGVISDGVNNIVSAQATGDLSSVTVLDDTQTGDEGTAMLEIIHDMVPDAQLYFHTGLPNAVVFNNAVNDLVAVGVNVIVDDLGFYDQPYFEDGIIASNIASILAANNIVYVSAAGNDGSAGYNSGHYQGSYYDNGSGWHDFSAGLNQVLVVNVPNGGVVTPVLQWDDSFGHSGNDYDLYLFNQTSGILLGDSNFTQNGDDDPIETTTFTNNSGGTIIVGIYVSKFSGSVKTLELFILPNNGTWVYNNNLTPVDSIFGHPAVPGVIAVGAIAANDPDNDTIESYSSQGPVTIIGQGQRIKPDVAGIDCVSVTGAGGFYTPFCGTSASAPHIAAVAAQLWGQYPAATGNQIKNHILNSAVDLGTSGTDTIFGHGRADSLLSFQAGPTITVFNFSSLTPPVIGDINEASSTITLTVPFDTNVTNLVTTFTTNNGISVKVATTTQTSAITSNNFTSPVTYTVTAEDGLTRDYIVTVNISEAPDTIAPIITLLGDATVNLTVGDSYVDAGATALDNIDGDITANIVVVNPVNIDVVGTYTITYNVSDAAGNPAEQVTRTVNVSVAPDTTAPVIDSFTIPETSDSLTVSISSFTAHDNVGVTGYLLTETSDSPFASDPNWSAATSTNYTFSTEGTKTLYAWAKDAAGNISLSLNDSVTITLPAPPDNEAPVIAFHSDITAENDPGQAGAIFDYTLPTATDNVDVSVLVICIPPAGTFFPIGETNITCDATDVAGNHAIQTSFKITVTDTEAPVIILTGENPQVIEAGTAYTELGATVSDNQPGSVITIDSSSVNTAVVGAYAVTYDAIDASGNHAVQVTRTVNVVAPLSSAKAITAFTIPSQVGDTTINEGAHTISLTMPYGTNVTALTPTIVITGASVSPLSGAAQDFTSPVTYTVTAEDNTTQTYTVTVTVAPNTAANILSFDSTAPVAIGVISGNNITLTVPFETSLVDLPITITLSPGALVFPVAGNTTFVDGVATIYTVTAQDTVTTQDYSVTVNIAANTAKDITSFDFDGLTPNISGVISGTNITLNVPHGTDVTTLVPTIGITGASVNPTSGVAQDFTNPITYTVTAADASTQDYIVTVTITAPSSAKAITLFVIGSSVGTIDEVTHTVAVTVPYGTDVTALTPNIVVSDKATVDPASGVAQNFTSPVTYTVTAEDNTTQNYIVTVTVATPSNVVTITSATYTVSAGGTDNETIINIPSGTSKATFLAALTKSQADQTWNDTGIVDPVVTGNTLVVTAQDGTTIITYTITVNAPAATPTPTPAPSSSEIVTPTITKKGDANGDNKIDKHDFSLMMANWGKIGTNICDFNGDRKVDKYDFALLMSNWSL